MTVVCVIETYVLMKGWKGRSGMDACDAVENLHDSIVLHP